MNDQPTYHGSCFCGAVRIEVTGQPKLMGYCHCESCRAWSGAPVNAFSIWDPASVRVTAGEEKIASFNKTEATFRQYCTECGGSIMSRHPTKGFVDVYAAKIPDLDFRPQLHIHYGEKVLSIRDGLPKWKDMPAEGGGSGEQLPE